MNKYLIGLTGLFLHIFPLVVKSQQTHFIDGYHGGIWGHYPSNYTSFITNKLDSNLFWKINLEIEPVTWDHVRQSDPEGYKRLQTYVKDQSATRRVEFVNPGYGQSYLFNIQGESLIRQFEYGILKVRAHFPEATFSTYSSEEPCFTSALPQILRSFGFQYASLKNPNTCWGGYTTAHGGELLNWVGPDGSSVITVPRYASEALEPGSTWQTTAWNNSKTYLDAARAQGIKNPVGMCLQDAGWRNGPWLGKPKNFSYDTWSGYITAQHQDQNLPDWKFSQENVQVSLVWGAQILQQLAQHVRQSENHLIMAEKIAAIQSVFSGKSQEGDPFRSAWENLLLAQHHDSWIVPYNIVDKVKKLNWGDQVKIWTDRSNDLSDSVLNTFNPNLGKAINKQFKVYNTLGFKREEVVGVTPGPKFNRPGVYDAFGKEIPSQTGIGPDGRKQLLFMARVPAMGFATYHLKEKTGKAPTPAIAIQQDKDGKFRIHNSRYTLVLNPDKGGIIESLQTRTQNNKEFAGNQTEGPLFNEMKGYFYSDSAWHSSADQKASVRLIESGPLRTQAEIEGHIGKHPYKQIIMLTEGSDRIEVRTEIDWQGSPGIGKDYMQHGGYRAEDKEKAFYNDRYKLSALFPLRMNQQTVYKNAAFDVTKSQLDNTYFNTWDSIKNNIIVNWVDVSQNGERGMALLTDHTTSYSHDEQGVLGLTLQYSGAGLWGRNYRISGPSTLRYALIPHTQQWDKAGIWAENLRWNEPLQVIADDSADQPASKSLLELSSSDYEISSLQLRGHTLQFRVFNSSGTGDEVQIRIPAQAKQARLVSLQTEVLNEIPIQNDIKGSVIQLQMPRFGIRTVQIEL